MNKKEYLKKLEELNFDKNYYSIISGGLMLIHGLKEKTNDIDIQMLPEYFDSIKDNLDIKKSSKYDYLYELGEDVEIAVKNYSKDDIEFIDGYPALKLEKELEWKMEHNREKDKEAIKIIKEYLNIK